MSLHGIFLKVLLKICQYVLWFMGEYEHKWFNIILPLLKDRFKKHALIIFNIYIYSILNFPLNILNLQYLANVRLKWWFAWLCPALCGSGLNYSKSALQGCKPSLKSVLWQMTNAIQINNVINTRLCLCLLRQYLQLRLHVESRVRELLIKTQPSQHVNMNYWPLSGWFRTMILLCASRTFALVLVGLRKQENITFRKGTHHHLVVTVWTAVWI